MATIINADNGVVSGVPGLKYVSDSTGNLQLQTNGTNALLIDTSQYPSATVNGLGTGRIPAEQFYRLDSALVGSNVTTAQSILGVGVTLVGSTIYQFECLALLSKTVGGTNHVFSILFGGTATFNNIAFTIYDNYNNTSFGQAGINVYSVTFASAGGGIITSTTAGEYHTIMIKGTVSVNAGGTFIPQYQLSAAPGGAYTTAQGSYFKISPLGVSGSNTSIGTWS